MRLDHLLSKSFELLSGILVMRTGALLTFCLAAVLRHLEAGCFLSLLSCQGPETGGPVAQVVRALC